MISIGIVVQLICLSLRSESWRRSPSMAVKGTVRTRFFNTAVHGLIIVIKNLLYILLIFYFDL